MIHQEPEGAKSAASTNNAPPGGHISNEDASSVPKERRKKHRAPIIIGVIAAVVIVAGIGFWTWHEQPSFCNAICHTPMDPYVEGYYNDAQQMAYAHQVEGTTCLQCHEAKIDEQVREAVAWMSGDYSVDEEGYLTTVGVRADKGMCATQGCHDMDDIVATTQDWGGDVGVNPHDSHQGYALDCSSCHTAHGQSIMYCNTCHDYEVPEGWTAPVQSQPSSQTAQD